MAEKNKTKLTAFEEELASVTKQVFDYKLGAEANIVAILYKNPEEFYNLNLKLH